MESKQKEKQTYTIWQVIFFVFIAMNLPGGIELLKQKFGWAGVRNDAPAAAPVQPIPTNPGTPPYNNVAPNKTTTSKIPPGVARQTEIHIPAPNSRTVTTQSNTRTSANDTGDSKVPSSPTYSPEFEAEWGTTGDAEFLELFEANYKQEAGISLNDLQRRYVHDVIMSDYKARLYKIFRDQGNSIPDDKFEAAVETVNMELMNESGLAYTAKLVGLMDGKQVAQLNSFLSGINAASQQLSTQEGYMPAFEYLWSGEHGDEGVIAATQQGYEAAAGVALNEQQKAYFRNTLVPTWKSEAAIALGKLDLSSGNVTGKDIQMAVNGCLENCLDNHGDKLFAMMDENQKRLIDLQISSKKTK